MADLPFRSRSLNELEDGQVVAACERNYVSYWTCAGARPHSEFSDDLGITRAITGLPNEIFNVVLKCRLRPEDVEASLDAVIEESRARRIPMLWHVGTLTEPADLGRHLEARGFPCDYELKAMAVDLASVRDSTTPPKGITVETVASERQSRQWIECLASSWNLPREVSEWMARNPCFNVALEPLGARKPKRRLYLGHLRDDPVGASMLFWDDEIAGLQAVGTAPQTRNRGVGSAVVKAALEDARAMGFRAVVVLSTVEGVRMYEKVGFRVFGRLPEHSMRFDRNG